MYNYLNYYNNYAYLNYHNNYVYLNYPYYNYLIIIYIMYTISNRTNEGSDCFHPMLKTVQRLKHYCSWS